MSLSGRELIHAHITDQSLIETQLKSFEWFLTEGLTELFHKFSPVEDFGGKTYLEVLGHRVEPPKRDLRECRETEATFEASLFVRARLVDKTTGEVKEAEVYLGEIPYMTEKATFLVNGAERVVVSQLARSPGVYFKGELAVSGRDLFSAQVIPDHGNWVEFEEDGDYVVWCKIGQGRRFPATVLLKALSYPDYATYAARPVICPDERAIRLHFGKRALPSTPAPEDWVGMRVADTIVDPKAKETIIEAGGRITDEIAARLAALKSRNVELLDIPPCIERTLRQDQTRDSMGAVLELFRRVKGSEAPNRETAVKIVRSYFFDNKRYDLSRVGRYKMNRKLGLTAQDIPLEVTLFTKEDVAAIVSYIAALDEVRPGARVDEIDHLENKRVRAVGELLLEQFRIGLARVEKIARERMSTLDPEKMVPASVINFKPLQAAIKSFFGSGQLSQFMDEVNPLSELTHKRRLSSLGPGGLSRRSAKLEVRDVHHSHYGRICPIETPEGQNVGLIGSLAIMARVDEYGFIQTPYQRVINGRVTDDVVYLSPADEDERYIAPADTPRDGSGRLMGERVVVRHESKFPTVAPQRVDFIDVAPRQIFSVATALIPFLENDEPTRGLMGANMQRQAVPLVRPRTACIRTGMEAVAARDSGAVLVASSGGRVLEADAEHVVIDASLEALEGLELAADLADPRTGEVLAPMGAIIDARLARRILVAGVNQVPATTGPVHLPVHETCQMAAFRRTNQKTCITQRPVVEAGQVVKAGEAIADGASTEEGVLALGRDMLVAYMPWEGYNYEDALVVSERLVKEDILTSVQIEKHEVHARDTKVGPEEITRDIPTLGEDALRYLDPRGIIMVGADVRSDDILVGKIAPKGPSELSPEEKLIVAIFSKKAEDMRDVSLRAPYGERGKVIGVRVFSRHMKRCPACEFQLEDEGDVEIVTCPKCKSELEAVVNDNLQAGVNKLVHVFVAQERKVMVGDKLAGRHGNKGVIAKILPQQDLPFMPDGTPVDIVLNPLSVPSRMNVGQILEAHLGLVCKELGANYIIPVFESLREDEKGQAEKTSEPRSMEQRKNERRIYELLRQVASRARARAIWELASTELGLELEPSVDPDTGEVVSLSDPKQVLGEIQEALEQRSEQEITEIGETLGADAQALGRARSLGGKVREVLARIEKIGWERAGIDETTGRCQLRDGRTGEPFHLPVVVGYAHIIKLAHLVEDKIHARSTGPYSLVTQQPLGGKAQMGGQRFGEMEVWALEAYGAAHCLQEMLTVKSDDVEGRVKTYEAMVKGENLTEPGVPESFVVLIKELQSLGLEVVVDSSDGIPIEFYEPEDEAVRRLPW